MSESRAEVPPGKMVVAVCDGVLVGPKSVLTDERGSVWVRVNDQSDWVQMEGGMTDLTATEVVELMQQEYSEGQRRDPISGNVIPFRLPAPTRKEH